METRGLPGRPVKPPARAELRAKRQRSAFEPCVWASGLQLAHRASLASISPSPPCCSRPPGGAPLLLPRTPCTPASLSHKRAFNIHEVTDFRGISAGCLFLVSASSLQRGRPFCPPRAEGFRHDSLLTGSHALRLHPARSAAPAVWNRAPICLGLSISHRLEVYSLRPSNL